MNALRFSATLALLILLAPSALAQVSVTVFGGYAVSEGIDNDTTGERASVKSGVTFGAAADYDLDSSRQLQLFYGQQNTTLDPGGGAPRFDSEVRYLHLGGTYFFDGPIGRGPVRCGRTRRDPFFAEPERAAQRNKGVDERRVRISVAAGQLRWRSGGSARVFHVPEQLGWIVLLGWLHSAF